MSYSFSIKANGKDEAGEKVAEELERVVVAQPTHAFDRQAAQDAVERFIDVLREPREDECIIANVNGSVGWNGVPEDRNFTSASVSVNVYIGARD